MPREGALLERPRRPRCAQSRRLWPLRHAGQRVGASRRDPGGDVRHVDRGARVAAAIDRVAAPIGRGATDRHAARGVRGATRRLCGRLITRARTTAGCHVAPDRDAAARTERTGKDRGAIRHTRRSAPASHQDRRSTRAARSPASACSRSCRPIRSASIMTATGSAASPFELLPSVDHRICTGLRVSDDWRTGHA